MTIRLNKVTRDLNVGIATVVEFLQKKGYTVEANPNTKITEKIKGVFMNSCDFRVFIAGNKRRVLYAISWGVYAKQR